MALRTGPSVASSPSLLLFASMRAAAPAITNAPAPGTDTQEPTHGGTRPIRHRVLLIENDEMLGDGIKRFLEHHGLDCCWYATGREALVALRDPVVPAAIICDVVLPDLSGFTVKATAGRLHPSVPVLLMSGHVGVSPLLPGPYAPVDLLVKPVIGADLLLRLRAIGVECPPAG